MDIREEREDVRRVDESANLNYDLMVMIPGVEGLKHGVVSRW
jgi:hypothetical protein